MTNDMPRPKIVDNDRDEITATLDGKEIRGWSYANDAERRVKMRAAREFVEGWFHAMQRHGRTEDELDVIEAVQDWTEMERASEFGPVPAAHLKKLQQDIRDRMSELDAEHDGRWRRP